MKSKLLKDSPEPTGCVFSECDVQSDPRRSHHFVGEAPRCPRVDVCRPRGVPLWQWVGQGCGVRRRGCWFICPRGWRPCLGARGPHRSPCGGAGGLGGTEAECVGFAARPAWVFQRIHSARPAFSSFEKMAALEKDHGAQKGCGAEEAPGRRP